MFFARLIVTLRPSIIDPHGSVATKSLQEQGFNIGEIRVGKYMEITLEAADQESAEALVHQICDRLLVNRVLEEYSILSIERPEG